MLTHIPVKDHVNSLEKDFLITADDIEQYVGLDISDSMIEQGRSNYSDCNNIKFKQYDLAEGLHHIDNESFD